MNRNIEEALLGAWMEMALNIRGDRLVEGLSFNEIVICRLLYRNMQAGGETMTAKDLEERTKFLKSQLNKVLNGMEDKGIIERIRSKQDKRKVYLNLCEDKLPIYLEEHAKVMEIVHGVTVSLGEEKVKTLTLLLGEVVDAVNALKNKTELQTKNKTRL